MAGNPRTSYWKKRFPRNAQELIFPNTPPLCSFDIMKIIISLNDPKNPDTNQLTNQQVKKILLREYLSIYEKNKDSILKIMSLQGKTAMSSQLRKNEITLDILINSKDYYLTNFDIWLLARRFNIPIILYSGTMKGIKENNNNLIILNSDDSNMYYWIKSPNQCALEKMQEYRLLFESPQEIKIPLTKFSLELQNYINEVKANQISFDDYLKNPPNKKLQRK